MPARRRTAKSCSRNWTGMSRRLASSPIGTGPLSPLRPSSTSARNAYGDFVVIEIIRPPMLRDAPGDGARRARWRAAALKPAALGRDEDRLGAVDRTQLAVDVVKVGADRARRELQLVGDLLVDLALGEALEHLDLAARERARIDLARAAADRVGQVIHDGAQLGRAEADRSGRLQQLGGRDGAALGVVGEHVGQADEGGLDDGGDGLGQPPAAGQHAADQRVVDAQLAALAVDALLRGARGPVDLARVAGVRVHEHEIADVVQERGDHQAVAVLVAGLGGQAVGGALGGDAVQAEALRRSVPDGRALEEVERAGAHGQSGDGLGREQLDRLDDRLDAAAGLALDLICQTEDRDDERHVGLDGGDDVAGGDPLGGHQEQQAVARLREGGERLEGLERGWAPAASGAEGRMGVTVAGAEELMDTRVGTRGTWWDGSLIGSIGRMIESCRRAAGAGGFSQSERAASMRRSDSSRPSTARVSKMPGETVVPSSATRSGW